MDYYASKDSQTRDTGYQSPSEGLLHIDNDLEAVIKSVASKITMIRGFRHQNDHFDVPDGNRIESPSLKDALRFITPQLSGPTGSGDIT